MRLLCGCVYVCLCGCGAFIDSLHTVWNVGCKVQLCRTIICTSYTPLLFGGHIFIFSLVLLVFSMFPCLFPWVLAVRIEHYVPSP